MNYIYSVLWVLAVIVQILVAIYLLLPLVFLGLHYILPGRQSLSHINSKSTRDKKFDFAGIVTAHQDLRFIPPFVDSCFKQSYQHFTIYVVADDCVPGEIYFDDPRIQLIYPEKPFHSKIKSIKHAVQSFKKDHDVLVIFDSDNVLHPEYFKYLNEYYRSGFQAVQTHMLSKNTNSVYAKLDSIGHIYNTFIERQAKMELGLSSSILGLGISLDTKLYNEVMYKDSLGGFDKKLQADIVQRIDQLAFAQEAIVYDEKVEDGSTLERQRTRWIYAYFKYFPIYFKLLNNGIKSINFNRFFFAFTALKPPMFLLLMAVFVFILWGIIFNPFMSIVWVSILLLFFISFALIILTQSRQKGMAQALIYLPLVMIRQIFAVFKLKKASKDFLKTEHKQVTYIDEILANEAI